jgi:hypothetical protein
MRKLTCPEKELNEAQIKEIRGAEGIPLPAYNCVAGCDTHCGDKPGSQGRMYESNSNFWN